MSIADSKGAAFTSLIAYIVLAVVIAALAIFIIASQTDWLQRAALLLTALGTIKLP